MDTCRNGHESEKLEELKGLIKARQISLGWTPLHCVIEIENFALAQNLVKEGANVNSYDNFNRTPLSIAASKGNLKLIKYLIEEGATINEGFPLHYACEKGHQDVVRYLIEKGADVNLEKDRTYPLIIAAAKSKLEVAKILIEHGADVRAVDGNVETALHWACESANGADKELIELLIDSGCDINAKDKFNITPLSCCLIRKEDEPGLVKLLLEKGASIDIPDTQNDNALHYSVNPETTLELIKFGVDVNALNTDNETPLYNVTFYKHVDCAKILLEHNANPNVPACGGWTPLHFAAKEGNLEYVVELLKWKADVNAASAQNIIPLHFAARMGHLAIVTKLLQHGSLVDVPVVDLPDINSTLPFFVESDCISEGATPLFLATANKHNDVAKLLISHGAKCSNCDAITKLHEQVGELKPPNKEICEFRDWPCNEIIDWVRRNNLDKIRDIPENDDIFGVTDLMGWSLLHHAVSKGLYKMSSELIKKGVSVNAQDKYERTPLTVGAARNDLQIVRLLLDNEADINLGLALHYAADKDSIDCMMELINRNCIIDIKNKSTSESSVLLEAASNRKTHIVKLLLEHKADVHCVNKYGETALLNSCRFSDIEAVHALLKHGANVNALNSFKDSPLICATLSDDVDIVKVLLENKADFNHEDGSRWTPLHRAAACHFETAVLALIKAGAPVDPYNDNVETPLYLASENITILKALIENNADVNFCAFGGWTPLHESTDGGKLECVKELLEHNVNVNGATAENILPIYLASVKGHIEIVKELFSRGSYVDEPILDVGVINIDSGYFTLEKRYHIVVGNTPMIGAASKGHLEVVKLLHSYGVSLETANAQGNTALHEAVLNGFEKIVEFLVDLNVNLDFKNKAQQTPLDLAKEKTNEVIVNIISNKVYNID